MTNEGTRTEPFALLNNGANINSDKFLTIITDMFSLDLNNKKIISLALAKLDRICLLDESLENDLIEINKLLYNKVTSVIAELDGDFLISADWQLSKYLKAFNFSAEYEIGESCYDKIIKFLQIASDLFYEQVICFVNFKSYLTDYEMEKIYEYSIYHKLMILVIESTSSSDVLKYERKLTIDKDFDEFLSYKRL